MRPSASFSLQAVPLFMTDVINKNTLSIGTRLGGRDGGGGWGIGRTKWKCGKEKPNTKKKREKKKRERICGKRESALGYIVDDDDDVELHVLGCRFTY